MGPEKHMVHNNIIDEKNPQRQVSEDAYHQTFRRDIISSNHAATNQSRETRRHLGTNHKRIRTEGGTKPRLLPRRRYRPPFLPRGG